MSHRIANHIRSNVIGYIALFLFAMGGSAYALDGPLPGQNQVGSDDIINGEVKTADIGAGEVKNGDIGAFEIKANNIAPDSLGGAKIADRSVKNADLGLGASSSNTIADGGIQGIDVKANTLTGAQIDESTLFNDNSLTGSDIDESTLSGVPSIPTGPAGGDLGGTYPNPTVQNVWKLGGNTGTTGSDLLGTADNQPLNLGANGARGLRIDPASDGTNQSPNVIGGIADNSVTPGVYAATIAGGGRFIPSNAATANKVTDDYGTVGGGAQNRAGDSAGTVDDQSLATVGGGGGNTASKAASTVAGGNANRARGFGATVGGGQSNDANADLATVGGGAGNTASDAYATVAGGTGNTASGWRSTITGGDQNVASGNLATVSGGVQNTATGSTATALGGAFNTAQGFSSFASGRRAKANNDGSFVWADSNDFDFASTAQDQFNVRSTGGARLVSGIDGSGNPTSGLELPAGGSGWSTLLNGQPFDIKVNNARGLRIDPASDGTNQSPNVIGGIADNSVVSGVHAGTIAGGGRADPANSASANVVSDDYGTVGGGGWNQAGDYAGTVSDRTYATVGGGYANKATGFASTVGGGDVNVADGYTAAVGGGINNCACEGYASLGGGASNNVSGLYATVPGGQSNTAKGDYSLAAGSNANADHQGAFVWADSQGGTMHSSANDQFIARAQGHFFLQGDSTLDDQGGFINTSTGAYLSTGGTWTNSSDENLKAGFERVNPKRVLARVDSLPVRTWHYKAEPSVRHIGPVAQDFYRAFRVGPDNKHIASVDADGVALAAIKGLSRKVKRLERTVGSLRQRLAAR
jgi:trimeric autotransporter adhesin